MSFEFHHPTSPKVPSVWIPTCRTSPFLKISSHNLLHPSLFITWIKGSLIGPPSDRGTIFTKGSSFGFFFSSLCAFLGFLLSFAFLFVLCFPPPRPPFSGNIPHNFWVFTPKFLFDLCLSPSPRAPPCHSFDYPRILSPTVGLFCDKTFLPVH